MAAIVEDTCPANDASSRAEKEDGAVLMADARSFKRHERPPLSPVDQSHPTPGETDSSSWRMENGSLPVPVPENQAGPGMGIHYVESSTTDSGVSNASSVTSDCVPIPHLHAAVEMSVPPTELRLGLRTVEGVYRGGVEEEEESHQESGSVCVSGLPPPSSSALQETGSCSRDEEEGREKGKDECGELTDDLRRLEVSKNLHSVAEGGVDKDGEDSCHSSSLDSSDTRSDPHHNLQSDVASFSEDTSLTSYSMDTQSCSSMAVSEGGRESPDSAVHHRRRTSAGLAWGSRGLSPLKSVFNRTNKNKLSYVGSVDSTSQGMIAASSTTGLILQGRPRTLPAKSAAEEKRHQKLYEGMVAAARKKELQKAKDTVRREKQKRQRDKVVADSQQEWQRVLPNWESMRGSKRVKELWWLGLPPGVRGQVWKRAIGNDLNISSELYQISLTRCREKLASIQSRDRSESTGSQKGINREQSVEVIHLDVLRTFPTLGFFQEGGPYNQTLHDVLGAYACYRPDVGYVQGMSFLAAVLLLNMEARDAFICLANLLNRPSYMAFFRVDHSLMHPYFETFAVLLLEYLPRLHAHFLQMEFSPEYYLIEWMFTLYTRTFPLDVACRVWDVFCRDGDCFLFRTALGVLRMFQTQVLERHTIEEVGQFLGHLPEDIDCNVLFQHIAAVNLSAKKFTHCLQQHFTSS